MTISSYSTLHDAVAGSASTSWSHKTNALSSFDIFLQLTESEIYSGPAGVKDAEGLRTRELETRSTATLDSSMPSRFLALPDNFLEARRAELEYTDADSNKVIYPLEYVPAPSLMEVYSGTGRPCYFTVTSQYEFNVNPDLAYVMEVQHYAKQTAISSSNSTNTVLTAYPNIYLNGVLSHLFVWGRNYEVANYHRDLFAQAIKKANVEDRWGRAGPNPRQRYMGKVV